MTTSVQYGWFGKVPCVGDFVRSGLSTQFVGAWDDWMQKLMIAGREKLGERWRECYFSAPIWRFALSAEMAGPHAVTGIVMPSVDRVGREYPLCLAVELEAPVWSAYKSVEPMFEQLEETALTMLEDGSSLSTLKDALDRIPAPRRLTRPRFGTIGLGWASVSDGEPELALATLAAPQPASIFVSTVNEETHLLMTSQLPSGPDEAASLFDIDGPSWVF